MIILASDSCMFSVCLLVGSELETLNFAAHLDQDSMEEEILNVNGTFQVK